MVTKLEHSILLSASVQDVRYEALSRREFNEMIRKAQGEDGYRTAIRLWKEGYIKIGNLGVITITKKGCLKMTEDVKEEAE